MAYIYKMYEQWTNSQLYYSGLCIKSPRCNFNKINEAFNLICSRLYLYILSRYLGSRLYLYILSRYLSLAPGMTQIKAKAM